MIRIPADVFAQIQKNGEEHYPDEGAGLLLGKVQGENRVVKHVLQLPNRFQPGARHNRYMIEPQDMILAEEKADDLGLEIIGVFHSHPDHPAQPSEYDRERALPWYSYIITKVTDRSAIESKSWRLTDERIFNEEEMQIE